MPKKGRAPMQFSSNFCRLRYAFMKTQMQCTRIAMAVIKTQRSMTRRKRKLGMCKCLISFSPCHASIMSYHSSHRRSQLRTNWFWYRLYVSPSSQIDLYKWIYGNINIASVYISPIMSDAHQMSNELRWEKIEMLGCANGINISLNNYTFRQQNSLLESAAGFNSQAKIKPAYATDLLDMFF